MHTTKTLWSDRTRARHFLIPDGHELPPGDFVLLTITGRQQQVDAEALAPFEVTQEEAKDWFSDQLGQFVDKAKDALIEALKGARAVTPNPEPQPIRDLESEKVRSDAPPPSAGLRLLSALSGEPVDLLRSDPQSVARAGGVLLDELGGIFDDSTSGEKDRLEAARQRVRRLRKTLLQQGLPASDKLEDIPDRLHDMYHSPDMSEDVESAAAGLEVLADGLERAGALAAERLRSLAARLRDGQPATEKPEKGGSAEDGSAASEEHRH